MRVHNLEGAYFKLGIVFGKVEEFADEGDFHLMDILGSDDSVRFFRNVESC
jgi:hypothetical protein